MDFKERFIIEYHELNEKVCKLRVMLSKYKNNELTFKPNCSYEILFKQLVHMENYLSVLKERSKIEKINL